MLSTYGKSRKTFTLSSGILPKIRKCVPLFQKNFHAERLYADIDFVPGATVEGVLYLISEANLARLDACEGYPKVYRRLWLEVEYDGGIYQAITYEMSRWTKFIRRRKRYPEEYRKICSFGADYYGIKNNFKK